jgi:C1A family cysteine protease
MKLIGLSFIFSSFVFAGFPTQFDLRNVEGKSFVSRVKNQNGGTCWTHATMAALESNLLLSGEWAKHEGSEETDLAEYHLDWWNGFNQFHNPDFSGSGLTVHEGGDYRVASAFLARGGAVRNKDGQSYSSAPKQFSDTYHTYYVRDVEWFDAGTGLENIDSIKAALMDHGAMGTALSWSNSYYSSSSNSFYQSPSSSKDANHAVAIVGWDDNKKTAAKNPGAWLIKNSWGTGWGSNGYFWISYYDKVAGHHKDMGAVSFQNVERLKYQRIYSHDVHGWRDTKTDTLDAFNVFQAEGLSGGRETLSAVSFYTTENATEYVVEVYGDFENGELKNLLSKSLGVQERKGFHTVDLDMPVSLESGQKFYVAVKLSQGGHAFDRTSNVPVLLGSSSRVTVKSKAAKGESYYLKDGAWVDLNSFNDSANFCIKALTH